MLSSDCDGTRRARKRKRPPGPISRRSLGWLVATVAALEALGEGMAAAFAGNRPLVVTWAIIAIAVFVISVFIGTYKSRKEA